MPVPRVVVFDLGKVLLDFDYHIAADQLARRSAASAAEILQLINQSTLLHRYETGLLTDAQFFAEVQAAVDFQGSLEEFGQLFGDIFTPIQPMVDLHAEVCARQIPTYVFSNTNGLAVRHVRRRYPFFRSFSGHVFSYEHQAMKPAPRLYAVLETLAGCAGPQVFYLDDRLENVEGGLLRGWQAILHQSPESTRAALEKAGVLQQ